MKVLLLVWCFNFFNGIISVPLNNSMDEWELFKIKYKKSYDSENEESFRKGLYISNKQYITQHNERFKRGEETYTLAMNKFGDLLPQEIYKTFNSSEIPAMDSNFVAYVPSKQKEVPKFKNWIDEGAVTEVKNQRNCGSCWSFSTTGALEGQHFLKTGELVSLSEQNLIDCSQANYGCRGGNAFKAYRYIINNTKHGIDTEASYPYEAKRGECRYKTANIGATVQKIGFVDQENEELLKDAVANIGPIAIEFHAVDPSFRLYEKGIYKDSTCSTTKGHSNHEMLIVGYGEEERGKYWLVKNSHGKNWGMKGYMKVARGSNMCGIANLPTYPIV